MFFGNFRIGFREFQDWFYGGILPTGLRDFAYWARGFNLNGVCCIKARFLFNEARFLFNEARFLFNEARFLFNEARFLFNEAR